VKNKILPLILALSVSGASHSAGQNPISTPLRFEVVSIRPSNLRRPAVGTINILPNGFEEKNNPLIWLIDYAYGVTIDGTVENEPSWVDNERFDLEAKVAPEDIGRFQALSREQKASMLRPILQDRFQLRQHTRIKKINLYYLEIATGGSKLVESKPDAAGNFQTVMQAKPGGEFLAKGLTMEQIIGNISYFAGRPVVDHTSLKGWYEFDLKWSDPPSPSNASDDSANSGPSFFTAVTEQLGLKLVPANAPFDVIVIDNVERPTPN
jgi:uncharacterized protein (TIGR03435 family)